MIMSGNDYCCSYCGYEISYYKLKDKLKEEWSWQRIRIVDVKENWLDKTEKTYRDYKRKPKKINKNNDCKWFKEK